MARDGAEKRKAFFYALAGEDPVSKMRWGIYLRWMLLSVVVLTTVLDNRLLPAIVPKSWILSACLPLVLLNVFLQYKASIFSKAGVPELRVIARYASIQLVTDCIFLAILFYLTGGVASPLLLYFSVHVILSGIVLSKRSFLAYVGVVAATFTTLSLIGLTNWPLQRYPSPIVSRELQYNPLFVLQALFVLYAVFFVCAYFLAGLVTRFRKRLLELVNLGEQLDRAKKKLELLNEISKITSSTLGLKPRMDYICGSIRKLMAVKGVTLRLLDERTNRLELMSSCGLSEAYLNKGPVDADKSLARALRGQPHFVADISTDPSVQYPQEAIQEGLVSLLSFPLQGRQKVIGTLRLYTSEKREFDPQEMDFLSALAGQGAIYIENAKIYDTLKRQDEAKNDFIVLMTHELKGPLTAIHGFLDVMHRGYVGNLTDKQSELIERIQKRIDTVMGISAELLDIYQWQSKGPDTGVTPISLKKQIQKAVDLYSAAAQKAQLLLTVDLPPDDPTIMATEEDIEKILNNLITNAMKYTQAGGEITVKLSTTEGKADLRVKDNGIGIASDDIPKIFNEFFRTKKAKLIDPDGSGLGLPFVKRIAESLVGQIKVESEEGEGTEFILTFPRAL